MGMPWVQTIAAAAPAGAQTPYAADWMQSPYAAAWSVEGLGGGVSGTYTVEYTFDDVNSVASPTWFPIAGAATTNERGVLTEPALWIRVNFATGPVGGSAKFRIVQGMTAR